MTTGAAAVNRHEAAAQEEKMTVVGVVTDTGGEPLAGVSVMVPGTMNGVSSGADGDYSITVLKGQRLRFSFIGFETQEITVSRPRYDVVMETEAQSLDHVVVTGYSQVELRKSTGAVGVVTAEELKDNPLKRMDQLLQGKLAGVNVQMTSGRPGATATVRIRGTNTLTGNAEPLWVVDGVPLQKNIPTMDLTTSQIDAGDFDNIFISGINCPNTSNAFRCRSCFSFKTSISPRAFSTHSSPFFPRSSNRVTSSLTSLHCNKRSRFSTVILTLSRSS